MTSDRHAMKPAKPLTKKAQKAADKAEALETLRELCPKGSIVFCILRHVSRSGMMRHISFKVAGKAGGMLPLDELIAEALDYKLAPREGVKVGGCGMDMGFAVVNHLSAALYGHEGRGAYEVSHRWL